MSGAGRCAGMAAWAFMVWILLTWTATAEQLVFGAALSLAVGGALALLGPVVPPWRALDPRRALATCWLIIDAARRIVRANLSLARRIWAPSRPLRSGMVVVATSMHTDAGLAWTGLISSLIVDNQIVDLDRPRDRLQYHAVNVPPGGVHTKPRAINLPVEQHLSRIIGDER